MEIAVATGMVLVAIVLLSAERIPIEVSSIAIVVLLVVTGLSTPKEALAGFSSDTAIFIFALLALTQGLGATGVMQMTGRRMLVFARLGPKFFIVMLLLLVCVFSSIASNTAVTAAFLPVAIASAEQARVHPSKLLMPLAFASILGGTITPFGTSTNLVVSAAMQSSGLQPIGFLELAPVGIPLAIIGIAATLVAARYLLRGRGGASDASLVQRAYLSEAALTPGSRLIGRTLAQLVETIGSPVHAILRGGELVRPHPDEVIRPDDRLVISGALDDLLRVKDLRSVGLRAELRYQTGQAERPILVEVSIPPTSPLVGKSPRSARFADRYGLVVLGLQRHPTIHALQRRLAPQSASDAPTEPTDIPLSAGDVLLVSGPQHRLQQLNVDDYVTILGTVEHQRPRYRRAWLAIIIFLVTVVLAALRVTSPAIIGLAGLLAMVSTGCVDARTAFRVDWRVVLMIGSLLALAGGIEKSGMGEFLAVRILPLAEAFGPHAVLLALMIATVVLSIPMSNQAAALIILPVGIHAGIELGLDPRTFAMGICLSASCALLTPLEPSAALVFGPGRYRFSDYLRVGGPLTALALILLLFGVPLVWPFVPV